MMSDQSEYEADDYSVDDLLFSVLNTKSKLNGLLTSKRKKRSKTTEDVETSSSSNVLDNVSENTPNYKNANSLFRNDVLKPIHTSSNPLKPRESASKSSSKITRSTSTPELNFKYLSKPISYTKSNIYRKIFPTDQEKDTVDVLKNYQKVKEEKSTFSKGNKYDRQPLTLGQIGSSESISSNSLIDVIRKNKAHTLYPAKTYFSSEKHHYAVDKSIDRNNGHYFNLVESRVSTKKSSLDSLSKTNNPAVDISGPINTSRSKLKDVPLANSDAINRSEKSKETREHKNSENKENIPINLKEKENSQTSSSSKDENKSFSLEIANSELIIVNNQNYFRIGKLGVGGSSIVYEVLDMQTKQRKAIKIVTLEKEDEATRLSYRNEIKILQKLNHSNKIITLFDYEETPSCLKLVMEAGNVDLAGILKTVRESNKLIPPFSIKHYWREMLLAVQVIHKEGIIHSDLKPANFLQVNGTLKLIDFGIASSIQTDMTSVFKDSQSGTFNFMSPESLNDTTHGPIFNCRNEEKHVIKISVKSDVWSLGCILYNLAYGKTPFQHITNPMQKLMRIANPSTKIDFPPLADKNLIDVLQKCLQFDPYKRPSITDLLSHPYLDENISPQVSRKEFS